VIESNKEKHVTGGFEKKNWPGRRRKSGKKGCLIGKEGPIRKTISETAFVGREKHCKKPPALHPVYKALQIMELRTAVDGNTVSGPP